MAGLTNTQQNHDVSFVEGTLNVEVRRNNHSFEPTSNIKQKEKFIKSNVKIICPRFLLRSLDVTTDDEVRADCLQPHLSSQYLITELKSVVEACGGLLIFDFKLVPIHCRDYEYRIYQSHSMMSFLESLKLIRL